jgi:hypothetical protein
MGKSSEPRDQKDERRPDRDNTTRSVSTHRETSLRKDDPDLSPGDAASTRTLSLSDSKAREPSSHRDEELRELRDTIDKYKKQTRELQISLKNMVTLHDRERDEKWYYMKEYNFVLDRTVRRYADILGIKSIGMTYNQRASISDALVTDAIASRNLRMEAETKDTNLHKVQEQLRTLQAEMLSRVDNILTIPDNHFVQEFHSLASCVRALSRSTRTPACTDISDVLKPCGFLVGVPRCHWEPRAVNKVYIEAWIWSVLVIEIFDFPLSIFGIPGCDLGRLWWTMFGNDHFGGWPYPSGSSETWRHVTTESLLELNGRDTFTQGLAELEEMAIKGNMGFASHVYDRRKYIVNIMGDQLSALSATADLMQIARIVTKASCLTLSMLLSRSRVQITYARIGAQFNEKAMRVHDTDDESLDKRTVAFVVRPGITKWGDAHGKHLEESFDVVPCEVQLDAGSNGVSVDPMDFTAS